MRNIYILKSDVTNYCSFVQKQGEENIMGISRRMRWGPFKENYRAIELEIISNDYGKKNYLFDFSSFLSPFFVVSDKCLNLIGNVLVPRGEVLPVITKSKRKKFFGYYPTNFLSGCLDLEKSEYKKYPNGLMIEKITLSGDKIKEEYLFTIEEDISRVFVTDKFKELVDKHELKGFDFSSIVELS